MWVLRVVGPSAVTPASHAGAPAPAIRIANAAKRRSELGL